MRLAMIKRAYVHSRKRICGKSTPNATATLQAVAACADGRLANAGLQENGSYTNGPRLEGRRRPIRCFATVTNRSGSAIAAKRKLRRVATIADSSLPMRSMRGEIAASTKMQDPNGTRNQPERPKSVSCLKPRLTHAGRFATAFIVH